MLKITIHDAVSEFRLKLEGKLSGPWVGELRQCWVTASSTTQGRRTVLDLREVDFIDTEGQALLSDMHQQGVRLVASTPLIQAVVEEACAADRCGTVEDNPAQAPNALVCPDTSGGDPRPL